MTTPTMSEGFDDMSEKLTEYAVEVPGRGYVDRNWSLQIECGQAFTDRDEASAIAEEYVTRYKSLGCTEIAATVRIVARVVTIERSDWEPAMTEAWGLQTAAPRK